MSAGMMPAAAEPQPSRDLNLLAPKFRAAVVSALADCNAEGLDAVLFEGHRSEELHRIYYARGRTVKPPYHTVTNATSALRSWHGFGLAGDVIHRTLYWSPPAGWWARVAAKFKAHGCDWGGDWVQADLPHFQWGTLRKSPSNRARELLAFGGMQAVWREVGADGTPVAPVAPKPRILTLGVMGEDVARLQKALGAPVTGAFDPITDAWVRGFQTGTGLTVDGDVGPATWRALEAA